MHEQYAGHDEISRGGLMTYFTFERRRLRRGEQTFDGGIPVGRVFLFKPLRERLAMDDRPARYLAKLPTGAWLPGYFTARHDAAEALRAHWRCELYEEEQLSVQ